MTATKKWSNWKPNPGFQPVSDNVRVKLALDDTQIIKKIPARDFVWEQTGSRLDVVEYRILLKDIQ